MCKRVMFMLAVAAFLVIMLQGSAYAVCDIRKAGKTVATLDGSTFKRGSTELGTFDGIYVKRKGITLGQYDGAYLKRKGATIGYVDGSLLKGADGRTLYTLSGDGTVKKNGRLYMTFSNYTGIFSVQYLMAVYLLFFDRYNGAQ